MPAAPILAHREITTLYTEHHSWLLGWLRRKLGDAHQAADLAQDTFVRVLAVHAQQKALQLREPRAYLTTVARNLLVNHVQRLLLERAWMEAMAQLPEPLAPSPEQRLLILETLHQIDAMLDGLPHQGARGLFALLARRPDLCPGGAATGRDGAHRQALYGAGVRAVHLVGGLSHDRFFPRNRPARRA